jgi:hypothetical protein
MADVSHDGGYVADRIDDTKETSADELNAVARENALRVERNRRRAERRADATDFAAVSDDELLIEVPSRTTSPVPSPPETPSSLAMHPALQNFDIICTICLYVHHRSLSALASTCRIFERPALDVLWRNLQSVEPLIKCLPSDLFTIESGRMVGVPILYDRPLLTEFTCAGITETSRHQDMGYSLQIHVSRALHHAIRPLSVY